MSQTAHHQAEMMRHFEAGRIAEARWHCRIWTRLVAGKLNDGTGCATRLVDSCPAGTPSPIHDRNAQGDARQEK